MSAYGVVLRCDVLERAVSVGREDHVHDVLAVRRRVGRDRIDDRNGPLERHLGAVVEEPGLLRQLSLERPHEALADLNAAPRQEPHLALGLLVPEKQDAALPAQDGRDANPRLGHRGQLDDDPNPRAPRSLTASSSTSTIRTAATGATTSWAMRIPGSTTNASSRSVLMSTILISPR